MRIVRADCHIMAPIERVWRHLVAVEDYHRWNPFIVAVRSEGASTAAGSLMHFSVRWHDGKESASKERIQEASAPPTPAPYQAEALWVYDFASALSSLGLVRARRIQRLVVTANNGTHYHTEERFSGALASLVPYRKVQRGFEDQAAALKQIAESNTMS
jgi:hypothetical protein